MFRVVGFFFAAVLVAMSVAHPAAQSQAINGTIEGTITDQSGAALPGVSVTVTNVDTGDSRVVVSNEAGVYRAPLLLVHPQTAGPYCRLRHALVIAWRRRQ